MRSDSFIRISEVLQREVRDARIWQIAALTLLLSWNLTSLSLGASLLPSLVAVVSALITQIIATKLHNLRSADKKPLDLRSPWITGLSLALLIRGDALWVPALAAAIGIGGKFLFRIDGKHLWNPAALGIVV